MVSLPGLRKPALRGREALPGLQGGGGRNPGWNPVNRPEPNIPKRFSVVEDRLNIRWGAFSCFAPEDILSGISGPFSRFDNLTFL